MQTDFSKDENVDDCLWWSTLFAQVKPMSIRVGSSDFEAIQPSKRQTSNTGIDAVEIRL